MPQNLQIDPYKNFAKSFKRFKSFSVSDSKIIHKTSTMSGKERRFDELVSILFHKCVMTIFFLESENCVFLCIKENSYSMTQKLICKLKTQRNPEINFFVSIFQYRKLVNLFFNNKEGNEFLK